MDNFLEMGFRQDRMDDGKPIFSKSQPKQVIKKSTPCQNFISTENSKAKLKEYFFVTKLPLPFFCLVTQSDLIPISHQILKFLNNFIFNKSNQKAGN